MAPTAVAKVNGVVIAESDLFETVEHNIYFPVASINHEYLKPSQTRTRCPLKGEASYYDIEVDGVIIPDGAWYYPNPKNAFFKHRNSVAFYKNKPDLSITTIPE